MESVKNYIKENWSKTIRSPLDKGHGIILLPKPFSSPSIESKFSDFYYWDTYFINLGLLEDGLIEQAKNNLDNIAFLINYLGYMPNASHLLFSSQVPLFTLGVFDYYNYVKDDKVLIDYFDAILREYDFFMSDRLTDIGLNQYGCSQTLNSQLKRHYDYFSSRLDIKKESQEEKNLFVKNMLAVCESGWDCTPRWDAKDYRFAMNRFVQIDLNSLLYDIENKIAYIYQIKGETDRANLFLEYAENRKNLIYKYMYCDDVFVDYNFIDNEFSNVKSTASFLPYMVGISNDKDGLIKLLKSLELDYGLSTCEEQKNPYYLQWDYPIMWAPQVYFTFKALTNNGLISDAKRVAQKYLQTVENNFAKTGIIWEKYNAKTGNVGTTKESAQNPMLGWTAGVYQYLSNQLKNL